LGDGQNFSMLDQGFSVRDDSPGKRREERLSAANYPLD